jgi:hypothetical protein
MIVIINNKETFNLEVIRIISIAITNKDKTILMMKSNRISDHKLSQIAHFGNSPIFSDNPKFINAL